MLAEVERRSPTLGDGRLLLLDGPGASGKTTLAAGVRARSGAAVVHLDDLYDGWDGLATVHRQLASLLEPLAEGRPGSYRRYDWHAGGFAETVVVDPSPLLVVEGVGARTPAHDDLVTLLCWVQAPAEVRRARAERRDGPAMAAAWEAWRVAESEHLQRLGTRERADVVVDGTAVDGTEVSGTEVSGTEVSGTEVSGTDDRTGRIQA